MAEICEQETVEFALRRLMACALTGDEARLLMVGMAGTNVSEELHQRCDDIADAMRLARRVLSRVKRPEAS